MGNAEKNSNKSLRDNNSSVFSPQTLSPDVASNKLGTKRFRLLMIRAEVLYTH